MTQAESLAPAKLNLFLYVTGKRNDGYHDIFTLMQKVSLYDRVSLSLREGDSITVTSDTDGIPLGERNTAYRAARLFFDHAPGQKRQVSISLEKHIPAESGMGGASSDAACVLKMMNGLLPAYRDDQLYELSKQAGSDVPFFMIDGAGLATGRGDVVKTVEISGPLYYVVVKPDFGISTQWAYTRLKILTKPQRASMCDRALYTRDDIMRCLQNDLEAAAGTHAPEIKAIKEKLLLCGAKAAMMTGSGSCVFGIFYEEREAQAVFETLSKEYTAVYKLRGL